MRVLGTRIFAFYVRSELHSNFRCASSSGIQMIAPRDMNNLQSVIPRAAVSIIVRCSFKENVDPSYLLVKRGKEPNKGMWSLPGGKIEIGESSLHAAKRELREETGLCSDRIEGFIMKWCEDAPISTSDSIHYDEEDQIQFHYVISQWFAEIFPLENSQNEVYPSIMASDDADDVSWWRLSDIQRGIELGDVIHGVDKFIRRSEIMYEKRLL